MKVTSGSEWVKDNGSKRLLEITLYDHDGEQHYGETWESSSVTQRMKLLQKLADTYVVVSMMKEGALSKEYGLERLKQIKES